MQSTGWKIRAINSKNAVSHARTHRHRLSKTLAFGEKMASFVGTKEEFKRYIGPRLRNLVQQLTKKHKMDIGHCEHCKSTESLEAAHVHGKNRVALIDKILENYTNNNMVTIDLASFEQHFKNEHAKIDETIIILCKSCHSKYDSQAPVEKELSKQSVVVKKSIQHSKVHPDLVITSQNRRIFSNQEIQYRVSTAAQKLSTHELEKLCDPNVGKQLFKLSYPLFIRVSTNITPALKREEVKDTKGINRWTWRYEFEKEGFFYAITTQWYEKSDAYVQKWLHFQK